MGWILVFLFSFEFNMVLELQILIYSRNHIFLYRSSPSKAAGCHLPLSLPSHLPLSRQAAAYCHHTRPLPVASRRPTRPSSVVAPNYCRLSPHQVVAPPSRHLLSSQGVACLLSRWSSCSSPRQPCWLFLSVVLLLQGYYWAGLVSQQGFVWSSCHIVTFASCWIFVFSWQKIRWNSTPELWKLKMSWFKLPPFAWRKITDCDDRLPLLWVLLAGADLFILLGTNLLHLKVI